MLIEFSVENFRSIKEKATLSMVASADKSLEDNTVVSDALPGHRLLNSAVIYGANASGKSNVLLAMSLFRNMVLFSHVFQKGTPLNHQPFAFDPVNVRRPTKFSISFLHDSVRYDYEMAYDSKRILEESLHHYPHGKRAMIFSREGQLFRFNRDRSEQEALSSRTLDNILYLSSSVQQNYGGTLPAFQWFVEKLIIIEPGPPEHIWETMIKKMRESADFKKAVNAALKEADFGISDIIGKVKHISTKELSNKLPPELLTAIGPKGVREFDLRLEHTCRDESGNECKNTLRLHQESEGTQRFLAYIGPIVDSLMDGKTLVIDEMDAKLHHTLSDWIVGLFHSPEQNTRGAQLLFNTHDLLLLNQEIFRRDQIWFTEKDYKTGATSLYSLLEFNERKDRDIMKGYRLGRYGAIPFPRHGRVV